jgi:predicted nucleic acid-binding Zn ribbon protein
MSSDSHSVKCVRDIREAPWQAFQLPSDGRQRKHLCHMRRALFFQLATFADGNGTNCWPSIATLARQLGASPRAVTYWLDDLAKLGFIESHGLTGFKGTMRRALNVAAVQSRILPVAQSTPPVAQSTPVQSRNLHDPVAQSCTPVAQATQVSPKESIEDCGQPALPKNLPPPPTGLSDRAENAEEAAAVLITAPNGAGSQKKECKLCEKSTNEGDDYCSAECAEKDFEITYEMERNQRWRKFQSNLPRDMAAASFQKGQQEKLEQLLTAYGVKGLQKILVTWIMRRELPVEGLRANRWGKFLEEYLPYVKMVETGWPTINAEWQNCKANFM